MRSHDEVPICARVRPDRPRSGQVHAVHGPDRSLAVVALLQEIAAAVAVEIGLLTAWPRGAMPSKNLVVSSKGGLAK